MSKKTNLLERLIKEGEDFSFENNKYSSRGEYYSQASSDFLSWYSKVEDFINTYYGENSGPYKMLSTVDKRHFKGYYQNEFETELKKVRGAIKACKDILPRKKQNEGQIISLLKNPIFWSVLVVVIGASYGLGYDMASSKFDKEKIELHELNNLYSDSLEKYNETIKNLKMKMIKNKD